MTHAEQVALQQQWRERVADFRASGLSGAQWCAQQGFPPHRLSYWVTKFRATAAPAADATWVALHPAAGSQSLSVQIGPATIVVEPGFDPKLLQAVVQTLAPCGAR